MGLCVVKQPRLGVAPLLFKLLDFIGVLQSKPDFVQAVEQAVLAVFGDVKWEHRAAGGGYGLLGEVYGELVAFVSVGFLK